MDCVQSVLFHFIDLFPNISFFPNLCISAFRNEKFGVDLLDFIHFIFSYFISKKTEIKKNRKIETILLAMIFYSPRPLL